ncbi:CIA30 family protein [Chroococcus sp. FPU101]|uniref:CIA30 family protein n=1 Tax=Chroococcus sp. FPU101 TaxID=1974212 RepID=UPI001A8DD405|nr:CIA30 family protein [Chroococcus sp. FPU101]GFE67596.1 NADH:ubiquinone oxidoreductase complex I intermediate-associated protein 30 [Chroococcus sp. FPU101]
MKNKERTRWDLNRFVQTLNYFEIIPFIGRLPNWLSSGNAVQKVKDQLMGVILVLGKSSAVKTEVINQLLAKNYQVQETIEQKPIQQISGIICCVESEVDEQEISQIIELTKKEVMTGEKILFDFTNPNENIREIWGAVDDVVMGGVSESNIRLVREKAVFSGNVKIENNGGFASVRTRNFNPPLDLSNYEGIELRVEGDGKRYKFITRCEGKWDGLSYCYSFDTIYNFPQTIQIPFKDLIPVFRAKTVREAEEFDSSRVYSFQLMQSKFEYDGALNPRFSPGLFGLEIESIKAYGAKQNTSQLILVTENLNTNIESIIKNSGVFYTIVHYSPNSSTSQITKTCLQALEKPELCQQTVEL